MFQRVCEAVYLVGGGAMSDERDCLVYLADIGDLVLIDCGCGPGWPRIRDNISDAGFDSSSLHTVVLTHCHVDHVGALSAVKQMLRCLAVAHALDADAIETGDAKKTAADWYGMRLPRIKVDHKVRGERETLRFKGGSLELLHTPGHTPGSMVALFETAGQKVLFGQDIHGPFDAAFGSDIGAWRASMEKLLALDADVLCEGHFGVFRGRAKVRTFIEQQLAAH